jgi:hypothetical protein
MLVWVGIQDLRCCLNVEISSWRQTARGLYTGQVNEVMRADLGIMGGLVIMLRNGIHADLFGGLPTHQPL